MKNILTILTSILLITISIDSISQCVTDVDLRTWSQKGPPAAGNWEVDPIAGNFVN